MLKSSPDSPIHIFASYLLIRKTKLLRNQFFIILLDVKRMLFYTVAQQHSRHTRLISHNAAGSPNFRQWQNAAKYCADTELFKSAGEWRHVLFLLPSIHAELLFPSFSCHFYVFLMLPATIFILKLNKYFRYANVMRVAVISSIKCYEGIFSCNCRIWHFDTNFPG